MIPVPRLGAFALPLCRLQGLSPDLVDLCAELRGGSEFERSGHMREQEWQATILMLDIVFRIYFKLNIIAQ